MKEIVSEKNAPSSKYARPGNAVVEDTMVKPVKGDAHGVRKALNTNQPIVHEVPTDSREPEKNGAASSNGEPRGNVALGWRGRGLARRVPHEGVCRIHEDKGQPAKKRNKTKLGVGV